MIIERRPLPYYEVLRISSMLEDYHKVFYTFFEIAAIYFTDEVPTAGIIFSKIGKPIMLVNESFWAALTQVEKAFVICHECLHVMLDHGERNGHDVPGATHYDVNIAQDITINEMIVSLFGFDRNDIRDWKNYAWIDTCFENSILIKRNETFKYYLEELLKKGSNAFKNKTILTLDTHGSGDSGGGASPQPMTPQEQKFREKLSEKLAKEFTADDLKQVAGAGGGRGPGNGSFYDKIITAKEKRVRLRISGLIKKLKATRIKMVEHDVESFAGFDRRFNHVRGKNPDMNLPGPVSIEKPEKKRLLTAVFMDVSPSCNLHFNFFKRIARAFIEEEKHIETVAYAFATSCERITLDQPFRAGFGTYFNIIEDECLKLEQEFGKYPDCVIIVTDGEGNQVDPRHPNRWIWLLTPHGSQHYIHHKSRKYPIGEVVFE